jgi:hypothetical protein
LQLLISSYYSMHLCCLFNPFIPSCSSSFPSHRHLVSAQNLFFVLLSFLIISFLDYRIHYRGQCFLVGFFYPYSFPLQFLFLYLLWFVCIYLHLHINFRNVLSILPTFICLYTCSLYTCHFLLSFSYSFVSVFRAYTQITFIVLLYAWILGFHHLCWPICWSKQSMQQEISELWLLIAACLLTFRPEDRSFVLLRCAGKHILDYTA